MGTSCRRSGSAASTPCESLSASSHLPPLSAALTGEAPKPS